MGEKAGLIGPQHGGGPEAEHDAGRRADAEDISDAVLYVVFDDGRYVTGTTHVVDAGGNL